MRLLTSLFFLPFCLDLPSEQLWQGEREVVLRAKTFAVLRHLVTHAAELVTKEDLLTAVWPNTYVDEGAVKICVQELRKALQDDSRTPQFIETVHRRGYRFIAPITAASPVQSSRFQVPGLRVGDESQWLGTLNLERGTQLVGREAALRQLHRWLEKALRGERQILFVTGEPGIGKTTLVDAF